VKDYKEQRKSNPEAAKKTKDNIDKAIKEKGLHKDLVYGKVAHELLKLAKELTADDANNVLRHVSMMRKLLGEIEKDAGLGDYDMVTDDMRILKSTLQDMEGIVKRWTANKSKSW
jgi:hypothetical protein